MKIKKSPKTSVRIRAWKALRIRKRKSSPGQSVWAGAAQSCSCCERCWAPTNALHLRAAEAEHPHLGKPNLGTASGLCAAVLLKGPYSYCISLLMSAVLWASMCCYPRQVRHGKGSINAVVQWRKLLSIPKYCERTLDQFNCTRVPAHTVGLYSSYWLLFMNFQNWSDIFLSSVENKIVLRISRFKKKKKCFLGWLFAFRE